jgi:hypothetical protein
MFDYDAAQRPGPGAEKAADGRYIYGLQWAEERDIREIRVRLRGTGTPPQASVEYWFLNWPYPPPHMPTIEDPVDDPWQGQWLKAGTRVSCQGGECRYAFLPLEDSENPRAKNLPGLENLISKKSKSSVAPRKSRLTCGWSWAQEKRRHTRGKAGFASITGGSGAPGSGMDRQVISSRLVVFG